MRPSYPFRMPSNEPKNTSCELRIAGMSCQACELKIERAIKALPGVRRVDVTASTGRARIVAAGAAPSREAVAAAIGPLGYSLADAPGAAPQGRPSTLEIAGLFALVIFLGYILNRLGLLNLAGAVDPQAGFLAVFLVGLLAASSSCIAVSGGLMLSGVTAFAARHPDAPSSAKLRPIVLFIGGRLVSYALFGGLIGLVGQALQPPPLVTGGITVAVAVFMLVMGLDMLGVAPGRLKRILPRVPKAFGHRLLDAQGGQHPLLPALLGAGTFFLPCGFTQSLQLYALTAGGFWAGAMLLFAFALGTAPALFALGWASSSLKGATGKLFLRFSGALVVVLGFWNVQNGLTVAGYPITLPRLQAAGPVAGAVRMVDGTQVVDIDVSIDGYSPNNFTLRKDVPALLRVGGEVNGCLSSFTVPRFGVNQVLAPKKTTEIALMPTKEGTFTFACGMGMVRGQFTVTGS